MSKEFTSMMWEKNDTLRNMTLKFNQAVKALEQLQYYSEHLSPAYQDEMRNLTDEVERQLSGVSEDIASAVQSITAESIGLGYVNNTSDEDKPISNAQQLEFDSIRDEMLTSRESEYEGTSDGENPEVSDPIKDYINAAVAAAIRNIAPERNVTSYGIATQNTLGVVLASEDVEVNPSNGKMTIPSLSAALAELRERNQLIADLVAQVSVNKNAITSLTHMEDGSTTGDAELINGRIAFNGTAYDTIGNAIRAQVQLLQAADREISNTYRELYQTLNRAISTENYERRRSLDRVDERLTDAEQDIDALQEQVGGLEDMLGDFTNIIENNNGSTAAAALESKLSSIDSSLESINSNITRIKEYINME